MLMARVIMGANTAGIYGAQIFRNDDRPLYRRGFGINIGVLVVALTLATIRYIDDRRNRRRAQDKLAFSEASSDNGEAGVPAATSDVQPSPVQYDGDAKVAPARI